MTDEHGAWRTFGERLVYDSRWVRLGLVDVQAPNGNRWEYHVVHLARIAIALVVNDRDEALMLWRYRFATDQWGYELLGGLVGPLGEGEPLVSFEPLPGQVTAPMDIYLWRGDERIGDPTETEEVGRVEWVPLSRVNELAQRQQLLGSGTLIALLYYLNSQKS